MEEVAERLGISKKLENANLDSPNDVVLQSASDLRHLLKTTEADTQTLLNAAAGEVYSWKDRLQKLDAECEKVLSVTTGDQGLDGVLKGGIPLGALTEVVGESASGKTQLCLQLCLTVQTPEEQGGLGGEAVYLHSEGAFPAKRVDQLADQLAIRAPEDAKRAIHVMRIPDREAQVRILAYQLPVLLARRKQIRLVVIDSINATYRGEATVNYERTAEIAEMGLRLKQLAYEHRVAVVAVNQVSDPPDSLTEQQLAEPWLDFELLSNEGPIPLSLFWLSLMKRPALGNVWANAVTTRIRLARTPLMDRMPTRRALFVEFSPLVPRSGCELAIAESGVRAVL